jgi:hypothetical protein
VGPFDPAGLRGEVLFRAVGPPEGRLLKRVGTLAGFDLGESRGVMHGRSMKQIIAYVRVSTQKQGVSRCFPPRQSGTRAGSPKARDAALRARSSARHRRRRGRRTALRPRACREVAFNRSPLICFQASGLGLEAQRDAIARFAGAERCDVVDT